MRITADTNLLVRAVTEDDERQSKAAQTALATADAVALTLPALCELAWVLARGYREPRSMVAEAIRRLVGGANVLVDRQAVRAGLVVLDAGGDFADGVIAHEGRWLGADTFVSFDKRAVQLLLAQGGTARLLG